MGVSVKRVGLVVVPISWIFPDEEVAAKEETVEVATKRTEPLYN